ncbi:hypothetical protein Tco_0221428 [Tanacetum coccineum]
MLGIVHSLFLMSLTICESEHRLIDIFTLEKHLELQNSSYTEILYLFLSIEPPEAFDVVPNSLLQCVIDELVDNFGSLEAQ